MVWWMMTFNTFWHLLTVDKLFWWTGVAQAIIRHFSANFKTPNTFLIIAACYGLEDNEKVKQSSK
jgi:hypothetical protein